MYDELIKRLRTCADLHGECALCLYQGSGCDAMPETPLIQAADAIEELQKQIPSADVAEVVRCKDCIYWQKPQIKLNDGTYRDYSSEEIENNLCGFVSLSVGINIGSYCRKYDLNGINDIPHFMEEDDFCSKAVRMDGGT